LAAPGTKASYGSNFTSLQSWITQQISAAGLRRGTDYDVYIAHFPQIGVTWAGLSNLRDANWINGSYSAGVTAHELGHSLALHHAHSIEAGAHLKSTRLISRHAKNSYAAFCCKKKSGSGGN